ncbi:MAG: MurT ligase domain-containing protein [Oscillospiraceae bacterium]|nr:MurT ligase domain-containing protein [Oscillospiraceae bacterium]
MRLRYIAALWIGKSIRTVMRLFGRNATFLPGRIAVAICPSFLSLIGKPPRVIAITGTNGKTTVANLVVNSLEALGISVLNNSYGSNTATGISCALFAGSTWTGKPKKDVAVLEVDERSAMHIFPHINAELIVVTNLFRDSIMRNAHPAYIAGILDANIPANTKLLLNADDLITCRIAPSNPRAYFGLRQMDGDVKECINLINDFQICPKCNSELIYDYRRYHHIGRAHCSSCDFKSPDYNYSGQINPTDSTALTVSDSGSSQSIKLPGDSVFNIYNTLTAYAALCEFGIRSDEAANALSKAELPKTRYNEVEAGGVRVIMHMGKERNALANSRAFDYVASRPEEKELILMMNGLGEAKVWSENICWLYDCDFEFLNKDNITRVVSTGARALDYSARLRFAGLPPEKLRYSKDELKAPNELILKPGTSVYIFYGTDSIDLAYRVRDAVCKKAGEINKP